MAAPDFLNDTITSWYYHQTTGMTDVNTIISDVRTALVTNLGWTEPSTALFTMPVDPAGRFFDVLLTRIAATNLEFRFRDFRGQTLCTRRIQIDATASVNYFASKYGFVVESLRATAELAHGWVYEQTPNQNSELANYLSAQGHRTAADATDTAGNFGAEFVFQNGVATNTGVGGPLLAVPESLSSSGAAVLFQTTPGTLLYRDVVFGINQAGANRWSGRKYQALICDSSIAFGTDKTVPIDDAGTMATFRVVGLTSALNYRLCVRKA